jgi:hypothetical protein
MAFLGKMFLAGSESLGGKYKSGISFSLSMNSPITYIHEIEDGKWQVEFLRDSPDVVARTTSVLDLDSLQSLGFDAIQSALDILSVKGTLSTYLANPATANIGVYYLNAKAVAYLYSLIDFPIGVSVEVKQMDASGKEVKAPPPPEPIWNESFRYYRLSQSSTDLFEAYRNLFLAFEALLNRICPIKRREGEAVWLKRCLALVNSKTSLAHFTPTGREDPVEYVVNSQYRNIRCKLQHAKFPAAALPHSNLSPINVKQAYGELVRIWRQIADAYFNVPTGGGVITYGGFEVMMANGFNEGATIFYTPDDLPPRNDDTEVSPQAFPVHEFVSSNYRGQIRPGVVRLTGYEDTLGLSEHYARPIHRVCSRTGAALFGVSYIEQGLVVSGVDGWECIQDFRLINASQPNIEFQT